MTDRHRLRLDQLAKEMRAVGIAAAMPPTPFDREEVGKRCMDWAERLDAVLRATPAEDDGARHVKEPPA